MKTLIKALIVISLGSLLGIQPLMAQKEKKNDEVKKTKVMFNKIKSFKNKINVLPSSQSSSTTTSSTTEEKPEKKEVPKKRKLTPPDVHDQISKANKAYGQDSYAEARFYIQQAIMGIELEMGYQILASMPETVLQTPADKSQDEVYSTGAGFAGMIVSREYQGDDGFVKASVGSNSALYSLAGMQASYNAQTMYGDDDAAKVIRYKGDKAYLKVDDYDGYEMMIPFGQSSVFLLKCSICDKEEDLMEVADLFDIAEYKSLLGE